MTKAFLQLVGKEKPADIGNISSGIAFAVQPGTSSYGTSKLAMTHFPRFIAAENPNVVAVSASPGLSSATRHLILSGHSQRIPPN